MIGSVIAMINRGTKYACQAFRLAPANRLIAPTGARLGGWGRIRSNPPIAVRLKAGHLEGNPSLVFIAFILYYFTPFSLGNADAAKLGSHSTSGAPSWLLTQRLHTKNASLSRF